VAFQDLTGELVGLIPGLPVPLARTYINRAWRKIRDVRPTWGWLHGDAAIVCPAQITAGTFNVVQYATTVTADANASAALLAQAQPGAVPGLTNLQIRFYATAVAAQIYNIVSVNVTNPAALVLTVDRMIVEATNPTSTYIVYRVYFTPPISDFQSFTSIVDMVNGYDLALDYSSEQFDVWDPQRGALGLANYCGAYKGTLQTTGQSVPMYELWPGSTNGQSFYCRYVRAGANFVQPTDTQPTIIPDDLIIQFALLNGGYRYAQMHPLQQPALKGANWVALMQEAREQIYGNPQRGITGMLRDTIRNDEEQSLRMLVNRGHELKPTRPAGWMGPIDAAFFQTHAITW
jgi:hypothetical protein